MVVQITLTSRRYLSVVSGFYVPHLQFPNYNTANDKSNAYSFSYKPDVLG